MNITGNMINPAKNIIIQGLTVKDTAITFMEPHCMPSVECLHQTYYYEIVRKYIDFKW